MREDDGYRDFLRRAGDHRILTREEERSLARRAAAGDKRAREELVTCNLRLVLSIAQHFRNRGLPYPDLIQEGIVGLHIAVDKFDAERGLKLSTYATWWIRKSIQQGIAGPGADMIRLPAQVRQTRGKALAAMSKHPDADVDEIARLIEEPVSAVVTALAAASVVGSINETDDEDEGFSADGIFDPHAEDPHDTAADSIIPGLAAALSELPENQREVIEMRFGIGCEPLTFDEIAERLGVKPTFVQARQREALAALRECGTLSSS